MTNQTQQRTLEELVFSLGDNTEIIKKNGELVKAKPIGASQLIRDYSKPTMDGSISDSLLSAINRRAPDNANSFVVGGKSHESHGGYASCSSEYTFYSIQYYKIVC